MYQERNWKKKISQAHQPKQIGSMIYSNNGFSLGSRAYQESEWWSFDSQTETPQRRWMLGLMARRTPNHTFPLFSLLQWQGNNNPRIDLAFTLKFT